MNEKEVQVTVVIRGDHENTPEEAAHHAMMELHRRGFIEAFQFPRWTATRPPLMRKSQLEAVNIESMLIQY